MILLILLFALACVGGWKFFQSYTTEMWGLLCWVAAALIGFALIGAGVSRMSFPGQMLELTQTRSAIARLGCNASEDVMGTALNANRSIVSAKYWHARWYAEPFYAPGVDTVSLIVLPECK